MKITYAWWFCCGWRNPWCFIDTIAHQLGFGITWVCDKHDEAITGERS